MSEVEVDFDAKTARVTAAPGKFDRATCEAALQAVGYGVATFEELAAK